MDRAAAGDFEAAGSANEVHLCRFIQSLLYNSEEYNYTTLCLSFSEKCIDRQPASRISARLHPDVRVFVAVNGGRIPRLSQDRVVIEAMRFFGGR